MSGIRDGLGCLLAILGVGASLPALVLSLIAFHRFTLVYNEAGRYVDPEAAVVFDQSAGFLYAGLAILCWLLAGLCFGLYYRFWRSGRQVTTEGGRVSDRDGQASTRQLEALEKLKSEKSQGT